MSDSKMNMALDDIIKTTNPNKEHGFNNKMKKKFTLNNQKDSSGNNTSGIKNTGGIVNGNSNGNLNGNNGSKKFPNNKFKFANNKFQTNNWNNNNNKNLNSNLNSNKFSQGRFNKFDERDHKNQNHYYNNVKKIYI
jgi:hypothetical protein